MVNISFQPGSNSTMIPAQPLGEKSYYEFIWWNVILIFISTCWWSVSTDSSISTDSGCCCSESSAGCQRKLLSLNHSWNGISYECYACKRELKSIEILTEHFRRFHSGILPFKCEIRGCKKLFQSKGKLYNHMQTHIRPWKCEYCNHGFSYRFKREKHMQSRICIKRSFKNRFQLYAALREINHPRQRNNDFLVKQSKNLFNANFNYLCEKCAEQFEQEEQLTLHLKHEHNIDIVLCNICDLPLANESSRRDHIVTNHMRQK